MLRITLITCLIAGLPGKLAANTLEQLLIDNESMSEWYALLHYSPDGENPGVRDQHFYLQKLRDDAPDAAVELKIARHAFFVDKVQASICHFPARYAWLRVKLSYSAAPLPEEICGQSGSPWLKHIPKGVSMAFPSAHVGSAPSMFGHIFMVLESDEASRLDTPAIDFAATVPAGDGGLTYAWRGIMGGYTGAYHSKPLYLRLRNYNNLEQRDVWLYTLDMTTDELLQLARHLHELVDIQFEYRFFSDNCGYRALALIDAVKGTHYRGYLGGTAAPAEVLSVLRADAMIHPRGIYPSAAERMKTLYKDIDEAGAEVVRHAIKKDILPDDEWLKGHPVGAEFLYLYYFDRTQRVEESQDKLDRLVPHVSSDVHRIKQVDTESDPSLGQPHARVGVSLAALNGEIGSLISFMPGYHSLADRPLGYPTGYAIEVLAGDIFVNQNGNAKLEAIKLLSIEAVNDYWFASPRASSSFSVEFYRLPLLNGARPMVGIVNASLGLAKQYGNLLFGIAGAGRIEYSEHGRIHGNFRYGPKFRIIYQHDTFAFSLNGWRGLSARDKFETVTEYEGEAAWYPNSSWGVALRVSGSRYQETERIVSLGLKYHF